MRLTSPRLCLALLWASFGVATPLGPPVEFALSEVVQPASASDQTRFLSRSEASAIDPDGTAPLNSALICLSRTLYWEAKGGSANDMAAVANVVLNRLDRDGFPDTVCAVVKQGWRQKYCQFSWWCDGRSDRVREPERYDLAKEIARKALNRQLRDRTRGATYFHDRHVSPTWAKRYIRTAETSAFIFYKPRNGNAR